MAKKKLIPMAICYDFDGTLAPGNMQEHNFLPALGLKSEEFWAQTKALAKKQDSDEILAYMKLMRDLAHGAGIPVRRSDFRALGAKLDFFPGVSQWFSRIRDYARANGVLLGHFIISSGLWEMIVGTTIAGEFAKIYASGFMYNENGVAEWPALAVNYTTKTQFLFRINKGTREAYDNSVINTYVTKEERPLPFENMIYILPHGSLSMKAFPFGEKCLSRISALSQLVNLGPEQAFASGSRASGSTGSSARTSSPTTCSASGSPSSRASRAARRVSTSAPSFRSRRPSPEPGHDSRQRRGRSASSLLRTGPSTRSAGPSASSSLPTSSPSSRTASRRSPATGTTSW